MATLSAQDNFTAEMNTKINAVSTGRDVKISSRYLKPIFLNKVLLWIFVYYKDYLT